MNMVSIIIPVYNVEDYLGKCVKSVVNQTYTNLEIVLVDDGSTDQSGRLCEEMAEKDSRIVVIHKKNGGLSDARNAGIDVAKGEYIFFLDSDDWIDLDTIECLLKIAVQDNVDIVECGYRNIFIDHIEEETSNSGELIVADGVTAMKYQLEWRYFKSVAWNKLYKRKLFSDGKRYPIGKYHEDEYFTHQLFYSAHKLVYLDYAKYNYVRERQGSITGIINSKILDSCYALRERVVFVESNNISSLIDDVRNMYCYFVFDRVSRLYDSGVSVDDKLKGFLDCIRKDKEEVLSWKISEYYKNMYRILCNSYETFGEAYHSSDIYEREIQILEG